MSKKYLLAHDFGTSGDKACLFSTEGDFLADAYHTIKTYYPAPGQAEQRPSDWWEALKEATREVVSKAGIDPRDIKALSFSSHGMTAIPVDKDEKLLVDQVMTWMDARSVKEAEELSSKMNPRIRYEKTGNSFDLALYPAAKILWIKRNMPEIYAKTAKFVNPKEYLAHLMTGIYKNTDYTEAGMSGFFNIHTHRWDENLLKLSEIDESMLLKPASSTTPVGYLTETAAEELGLHPDTLVVLGSWDNFACATGGGVHNKGTFVSYLGTAGWLGVTSTMPLMAPDYMSNIVYAGEGKYFTTVHSHSACVSYEWVIENMCANLKKEFGKDVYEEATKLAKEAGAGAGGVFFLPSMFSGNTFYSDTSLGGSFLGLKMHHTQANVIRAAMEGPAFDMMIGVEFYKMLGVMSGEARLIGGGAKNDLWMQILASMFGIKMMRPQNLQHIGALGAALMAGVGAGLISSFDVVNDIIKIKDCVEPILEEQEAYRKLLPAFKSFYEGLMPPYRKLSKIEIE
jgi:sugar (pentulose or hexulose) kinase